MAYLNTLLSVPAFSGRFVLDTVFDGPVGALVVVDASVGRTKAWYEGISGNVGVEQWWY